MSEQHMRELLAFASRFSEQAFARDGAVYPLWHAVTRSGDHLIERPPHPDKDTAAALIRAYFELRDVVRYIWIAEAWTLEKQPLGAADELFIRTHGVSAHPERVEVVAFQGEDEQAGQFTAHRLIIRPKAGKAYLAPLKMLIEIGQRGVQSEGRLAGMLPVKGPKQ